MKKSYLCTVKKAEEAELLSETIEAEHAEAALQQLLERNRAKLRAAGAPGGFGTPLRLENDLVMFENDGWHFSAKLS